MQIRSVKASRLRMELVHNKSRMRLGPSSTGKHVQQSHGFVKVKKVHPAYVKTVMSGLRIAFPDFEFDQVNYKDYSVVRYRTVGSKGWYEEG
jgi:hypothetical protein